MYTATKMQLIMIALSNCCAKHKFLFNKLLFKRLEIKSIHIESQNVKESRNKNIKFDIFLSNLHLEIHNNI